MDKPNRGNTIKIKLNGEEQNFKEESSKKGSESSNDSFPTVIKIDPDLIEQDGHIETAAAQESADESFDWIIPESAENDIGEYKIINSQKPKKSGQKKLIAFSVNSKKSSISTNFKKRDGGPLKSLIFTIVTAILIGTSFGVLMLKLVITDSSKPAVKTPVVEENGSDEGTKEAPASTTSAVIGAQTVFIVQEGAYSSEGAAKEGANLAVEKGAPAQTLGMDGKERVLLGVADSIETAKQLGTYYKSEGIADFLPKSITIGEKTVADINESEKNFLEAASAVFQQLSKVTTNAILTKSISDESVKAVTALGDQINQNKSKLQNEQVKSLNTDLTNTVEKLKSFQGTKDTKSLIEAQQHLLNFLTVYYSL